MILCLETSTKNCSVAIINQNKVLASKSESADQYIHSEKLHLFIQEVLGSAGLKPKDLKAVAVGKGPGSYTGLRIGVSAAKGFCYSLNIPLLSADGPEILTQHFLNSNTALDADDLLFPMIDARRMEVYCAAHNNLGERVQAISARVINEDFPDDFPGKTLHLFGDGADKLQSLFRGNDRVKIYEGHLPEAPALGALAEVKLKKEQLEDVAYFEPFYLKNFKAIKAKNPFA